MKEKNVVVFGIFDGVHVGHEHFFKQAGRYGSIVAIVGRDAQALEHKVKTPMLGERKRLARVASHPLVSRAVLGDTTSGAYRVLLRIKPDVICLGYDQKKLRQDLERWMKEKNISIPLRVLKPHKAHIYHSSLLNR